MSSNIQAVEAMNSHQMRSTIQFIKKEIKETTGKGIDSNAKAQLSSNGNLCKNALTGHMYPFQKGSSDESNLYTVMPLDGNEKIYFDSKEEYYTWSKKDRNRRKMYKQSSIPGSKVKQNTDEVASTAH